MEVGTGTPLLIKFDGVDYKLLLSKVEDDIETGSESKNKKALKYKVEVDVSAGNRKMLFEVKYEIEVEGLDKKDIIEAIENYVKLVKWMMNVIDALHRLGVPEGTEVNLKPFESYIWNFFFSDNKLQQVMDAAIADR